MDSISQNVVTILQYLLPGFLAAWVFYGFTSYPKPSQFERVIQALIFTLIIQAAVFVEKAIFLKIGVLCNIGKWHGQYEILCSTLSAIFLGTLFSYFSNNDKFHKVIRKIGISRETSFPSEWFGTFLKNVTYIVLHLKDGRRLYGWPIEWPSVPDRGHFLLVQASWLKDTEELPIKGVESILIDVRDVRWVEFMEKTWEAQNGKEKLKSAAT
ncbi:MAG: hypothetical protein H8E10_14230 [Desulfobacterales bacterium]|nr:hypothetical protein [Desulfobacterales bacterium]